MPKFLEGDSGGIMCTDQRGIRLETCNSQGKNKTVPHCIEGHCHTTTGVIEEAE